ncbi:MAG: hypothetical protein JWM74_2403 [Myxococcaceae bacterium]|nr:hypothetical protein [Myxococcaceae bacterium]
MLESLRIAAPCPARWEDMIGDDRTRFCHGCAKDVHDLSKFTREEAEALLAEHGHGTCVRLTRRADGTVITGDCPVGTQRRRRRAAATALASSVALSVAAVCAYEPEAPVLHRTALTPLDRAPHDLLRGLGTLPPDDPNAGQGTRSHTTQQGHVVPPKNRTTTTMGCVCTPGDPLCSCL